MKKKCVKRVYAAKDTVKRVKDKIFANHILDKVLVSKTYEKNSQTQQ